MGRPNWLPSGREGRKSFCGRSQEAEDQTQLVQKVVPAVLRRRRQCVSGQARDRSFELSRGTSTAMVTLLGSEY